jgi:hypothetical protein
VKGPYGTEFSGWWLVLAVILMAAVISFLPHAPDLQYTGGRP